MAGPVKHSVYIENRSIMVFEFSHFGVDSDCSMRVVEGD